MGWLRARLGEGSTYAGLSVLSAILAARYPQYGDAIMAVTAALAGGAVVTPK